MSNDGLTSVLKDMIAIAKADGDYSPEERSFIKTVAEKLGNPQL